MKLNHAAPFNVDPCASLGDAVEHDIVTHECVWSCICEADEHGEIACVIAYAHPDNSETIAAIFNACHGLDLPPDIPAGAVANLIAAARAALEAYDLRGYGIGEEAQELEDALAPFAEQNLAPVSPEIPPDRRPVWSFEVDGQHVRWCGTLEQFHKDRVAYVDKSQGEWAPHGPTHYRFIGTDGTRTTFRAVKS